MTQRNLQCLWNSFGTINARKRHSLLHSPLLTLAHRQLVVTQNDGLPCGLGMGSAVVQVAYAVQQSDGTLSGWTVNQDHPLPCPVAAQAIAYDAVSNSIVLMGGDATGMGGDSTVVYQGTLDSNFDVTGWSFLPSLQGVTGPISRNAGATWNGYVYTLGGLVGLNDDTNAVYYLKVP
jgi:hypothetical protein